ncbi:uncharacterized protein LOC143774115 [Ranitomeya variabilis]|uniref:uncharacterized protein LOC143774115 n=1 Tax=Ranitomeya variabilis TaxID=490064 RepID=UPI004055BD14
MSSSSSSSEECPGPERESETSSSTAAEAEQEQQAHVRVARWRVQEQDEEFIDNDLLSSLVEERVPLWDTQVQQHSFNVVIWRLRNEVAREMMDGWDNITAWVHEESLNKVRTCWRLMKDRFNKDLRQESQVPSGSAARIRKYNHHRMLAFLRPVLAHRLTWSSTLEP